MSSTIIDFTARLLEQRARSAHALPHAKPLHPEELGIAIQILIQQLRQFNPTKQSSL